MPKVYPMAHFKPRNLDFEQKTQSILNYFVANSEPKLSRGKVWYVLNSNQFGKDSGLDCIIHRGSSRKIFSENKNELLKRKLICEITPTKERGKFYSITPLGICSLGPMIPYFENILKILETFATKYTEPYKSYVFGNEKINFKNFVTDLLSNDKKIIEDLFNQLLEILGSVNTDNMGIFVSLPLRTRGNFEFSIANIFLKDNEIKLAEYSSPPYSEHIGLNDIQFYQYLAKLLLCLLVYSNSYEEHGWSIMYLEYMKLEGKKPNSTDILPTLSDNTNFKQITFIIHRAVQTIFEFSKKEMDYFSNTLKKVQFEVEIS